MKYNSLIGLFLTTALVGCGTTQVSLDPYEPGDGYVYQDVVLINPGEGDAFTIRKVNTYRVKKGNSGAIACAENYFSSSDITAGSEDTLLSAAEKAGIPDAIRRKKQMIAQQGSANASADCLPDGAALVPPAVSTTAAASTTAAVSTTAAPSTTVIATTTAAPTSTAAPTTTAAPTSTAPPPTTAPPPSTPPPPTTEGPISVSDMRLKRDIAEVGRLSNGLALYRFRYLQGDAEFVGVMAQEVLQMLPDAVVTAPDGFYRVNYDMVGFRMCLYSQWLAETARPDAVEARAAA